mmetsp:Transcript_15111/g.37839  ORF Transcript_15111/g.37839 Transcript_15111/m.37839 type:complete len:249 (-) Transcript_15111:11-757(-)
MAQCLGEALVIARLLVGAVGQSYHTRRYLALGPMRFGEAVDLHLKVVEARVAPVVPAHTLDGSVSEGGREEGRPKPAVGKAAGTDRGNGGSDVGLEPSGARADGRRVGARGELGVAVLILVEGAEVGVEAAVDRHAAKDEEEGVRNEGAGVLGKAEGRPEGLGEDGLRHVVGGGEASSHADDMLSASAPERLVDLTPNQLVEDAVVHLLGGVLDVVGQVIRQHVRPEGLGHFLCNRHFCEPVKKMTLP